ncbi:hypothetical protein [Streptomyces sp. NPDC002533]
MLTFISLAYLTTITVVSAGVAYSNGLGDGWVGWLYVPAIVGFNFTIASYWGAGRVELSAGVTWLGPPVILVLDIAMGSLFNGTWPLPPYFPPSWLLWLLILGPGLACLPFTYRIWLGRQEPAPANGSPHSPTLHFPPRD